MFTDGGLDNHLQHHFRGLEDDLLAAVESDTTSMKAFVERLSVLQSLTNGGIAHKLLSTSTLSLVRRVASRGVLLANHFLDIQRINADVENKRQAQLEDAFSRLNLTSSTSPSDDSDSTPTGPLSNKPTKPSLQTCRLPTTPNTRLKRNNSDASTSSSSTVVDIRPIPPHIPRAYEWLLEHLHNPYPTAFVKSRIAKETDVRLKTVNEWFINARRRIGWTSICKRYFNGNRALAVDCARSFFTENSHYINEDVVLAFVSMKEAAERLFDGKLETSEIAQKLDVLVNGASSENKSTKPLKRRFDGSEESRKRARRRTEDACELSFVEEVVDVSRPSKGTRTVSPFATEDSCNMTSSSRSPSAEPVTPRADSSDLNLSPATFLDTLAYNLSTDSISESHFPINSRKRRLSLSEADDFPTKRRSAEEHPFTQCTTTPDEILVPDTSLWSDSIGDVNQIMAGFDFSIPASAVIGEQIPEGLLDLNVFDTSDFPLEQGSSVETDKGIPLPDWFFSSSVDSHFGDSDQIKLTSDEQGQVDRQEYSQLPSITFVQQLQGDPSIALDEAHQFHFNDANLFNDTCRIPESLSSSTYETTRESASGVCNAFTLDLDSSLQLLQTSLKTTAQEQSTTCQFSSGADVHASATVQPSNCGSLVDDLLKSDRQAKLEQLVKLREEKERLAEEERQLEHILSQCC